MTFQQVMNGFDELNRIPYMSIMIKHELLLKQEFTF